MKRLVILLLAFTLAVGLSACEGSLLNPRRCHTTYGPWDTLVVRNATGDSIGTGLSRWFDRVCE